MLFEDKPLTSALPHDLQLEELEEQILECLYRDIDKINTRITLPRQTTTQEEVKEGTGHSVLLSPLHPESIFKYAYVDRGLIEYLKELLGMFTLEDNAELAMRNKEFLVARIQGKLKDHGVDIADKGFITLVVDLLRIVHEIVGEENAESKDERDKDLFLYVIASTFLKVGIEPYTMEENSISGFAAKELNVGEDKRSVSELIG